MKDAYEVLRQKEADVARVRREIQSLKIAASLLEDESDSGDLAAGDSHDARSTAETRDLHADAETRDSGLEATGTDGLFSSLPRPRFWDALKRAR
ncbi:MAG TPA: hypothetical protein VFB00_07950 [Terriglobales bacterium]|nr:hypothetical protein [Terriglobales bacterium]